VNRRGAEVRPLGLALGLFAWGITSAAAARSSPSIVNRQLTIDTGTTCGTHCGTERWAVKTFTDGDTGRVNAAPDLASVTALRALHAPPRDSLPAAGRIPPFEMHTYVVQAVLLGWKLEADSDLHLVIAEPANHRATMIAEIPASGCAMMCSSPVLGDVVRARAATVAALGHPSHAYKKLARPRPITVAGIGFFDFIHGQTGVAPNGAELHPVLNIIFGPP
jgi:hypothetical protein